MLIGRRSFLTGLIVAPIVVKSGVLMPVKKLLLGPRPLLVGQCEPLVEGMPVVYQHMLNPPAWWLAAIERQTEKALLTG